MYTSWHPFNSLLEQFLKVVPFLSVIYKRPIRGVLYVCKEPAFGLHVHIFRLCCTASFKDRRYTFRLASKLFIHQIMLGFLLCRCIYCSVSACFMLSGSAQLAGYSFPTYQAEIQNFTSILYISLACALSSVNSVGCETPDSKNSKSPCSGPCLYCGGLEQIKECVLNPWTANVVSSKTIFPLQKGLT